MTNSPVHEVRGDLNVTQGDIRTLNRFNFEIRHFINPSPDGTRYVTVHPIGGDPGGDAEFDYFVSVIDHRTPISVTERLDKGERCFVGEEDVPGTKSHEYLVQLDAEHQFAAKAQVAWDEMDEALRSALEICGATAGKPNWGTCRRVIAPIIRHRMETFKEGAKNMKKTPPVSLR